MLRDAGGQRLSPLPNNKKITHGGKHKLKPLPITKLTGGDCSPLVEGTSEWIRRGLWVITRNLTTWKGNSSFFELPRIKCVRLSVNIERIAQKYTERGFYSKLCTHKTSALTFYSQTTHFVISLYAAIFTQTQAAEQLEEDCTLQSRKQTTSNDSRQSSVTKQTAILNQKKGECVFCINSFPFSFWQSLTKYKK